MRGAWVAQGVKHLQCCNLLQCYSHDYMRMSPKVGAAVQYLVATMNRLFPEFQGQIGLLQLKGPSQSVGC